MFGAFFLLLCLTLAAPASVVNKQGGHHQTTLRMKWGEGLMIIDMNIWHFATLSSSWSSSSPSHLLLHNHHDHHGPPHHVHHDHAYILKATKSADSAFQSQQICGKKWINFFCSKSADINEKSNKSIVWKQETKNMLIIRYLVFCKTFQHILTVTHCRIESCQALRLIDNLSAENSKLYADSGIHGIPLLECMILLSYQFVLYSCSKLKKYWTLKS